MNKADIIIELSNIKSDICESCPAMKKVDNLADAIDQAVLISREAGTPFKVSYLRSEIE